MTPEEKVVDLQLAIAQAKAELFAIVLRGLSYQAENALRASKCQAHAYGENDFRQLAMDAQAVANCLGTLRSLI